MPDSLSNIAELTQQLEEVDGDDVEKLLNSHGKDLTNDELMQLENGFGSCICSD